MAMVGLVRADIEVVDGKHDGQSQVSMSHVGRRRSILEYDVVADDTRSHHRQCAQLWVWIARFSRGGVNTGFHFAHAEG